MTTRELTDKQRAFCEHYLRTWNASKSAELAGYKGSYQTIRAIGSQNLTKPHIRAYLESRFSSTVMKADEILSRLGAMARGELPTKSKVGTQTYDEFDTKGAIVELGRHYALFTDRVKIEDWQDELLALLQEGKVSIEEVQEELGDDLYKEFFESAGVQIAETGETET